MSDYENEADTLKVKRLHPDAVIPAYHTDGAACFDLHALSGAMIDRRTAAHIPTGLAFEIPAGYVMLIYSRSGHGFKHGVRLVNAVGVIDSDYRGEVVIGLHNDGLDWFTVLPGDRIAQAKIVPAPRFKINEVFDLSGTVRGAGGFGSTGA